MNYSLIRFLVNGHEILCVLLALTVRTCFSFGIVGALSPFKCTGVVKVITLDTLVWF